MSFDSPEQELTIKIAEINGIHINYMNVFKTSESKVFQNLTT